MTNLLNPAFAWVCRFMGHRWRRLRKAETSPGGPVNLPVGNYRICARCGATKLVRLRKTKLETA